jgi:hypothetical protein
MTARLTAFKMEVRSAGLRCQESLGKRDRPVICNRTSVFSISRDATELMSMAADIKVLCLV